MNQKPVGDSSLPPRRRVSLRTPQELAAELKRLRRLPLRQRGMWKLEQACRHLSIVIEGSLTPPESNIPTPEQTAKREGFFNMIFAPGGMPEGIPSGATTPPDDCAEADVDRLLAAFDKLAAYPHQFVKVGSCGPVPISDVVRLHLAHAAHHLSFQEPTTRSRDGLAYANEAAALVDVENLRHGYTQLGNWTLAQTCWHMGTILKFLMQPSQSEVQPPTQEQKDRLKSVLESGKIGPVDAPPQVLPPENAGDEAIDLYVRKINEMATYTGLWTPHRLFGSISNDDYRRFILIHAAHHFAHLIPTSAG